MARLKQKAKYFLIFCFGLFFLFQISNIIQVADENAWVQGGSKFEQAIINFNPADTYVTEVSHRLGVSVLWVSAIIYIQTNLSYSPQLIVLHRFVFLVIDSCLFLIALNLLKRYTALKNIIIFSLYMVFNRYFIFISKSSWLDQFLVLFGFLTILLWINYLENKQTSNLIKTGIVNGLNFLTKYAGWYFFPILTALTMYYSLLHHKKFIIYLKPLFAVLFISFITLILFYPEIWVDPQKALLLRFQDPGLKVERVDDIWSYLNQIRYLDPVLLIGSIFVIGDIIKKEKSSLNLLGVSGLFYLGGFFLTFLALILLGRLNFSFLEGFYRYTFPAILPLALYTFSKADKYITHSFLRNFLFIALFLKEFVLQ